jgi:probable HAF family extracellular repeat protein
MKSILLVSICTVSLLVALAAPTQLAAQEQNHLRYTVTDLGTLGGTTSIGFSVNNSRGVVGAAQLVGGNQHAFFWHRGHMTDLGTLGGPNSIAYWLNDRNEATIASDTSTADPLGEDFCGFGTHLICLGARWNDGTMTALPTLGGNNSVAFTLNDRGQIVGAAENKTQDPSCPAPQVLDFEAVIWGPKPSQIRRLRPLPGDTVGFALGVNNRGQAVGASGLCSNTPLVPLGVGPHAVLWDHGKPINLGSLGGAQVNTAAAINDRGEVIGGSDLSGDTIIHSFLWTKAKGMKDLGTLSGDAISLGGWINNKTQVVGWSCDSSGNCRAYLWQNNVMTDLNSLISAHSKLYLTLAYGITDAGDIVGQAMDKNTGDVHAFLARPVRLQGSGANAALKDVAAAASSVTLPDAIREELQKTWNGRFAARPLGLR